MKESYLAAVLACVAVVPLSARGHIGSIDFFGYKGVDLAAVRAAMPVHVGDAMSRNTKDRIQQAVKNVTGREPTDVAQVCCDLNGDDLLYIGLGGASSADFALDPAPYGDARLSKELMALSEKADKAEEKAVLKGNAMEENSAGYRLMKDPEARAAEMEVRKYALAHEAELIRVLQESRDGQQRAIAADALGYGERTPAQFAALVRACRDPDGEVRNEATRALGEMSAVDPEMHKKIPVQMIIDMLRSGTWTDRNKASLVLIRMTQSRDPQLMAALKAQALDALAEMARWHNDGHAMGPRMILGRIAGVADDKLMDLTAEQTESIVAALQK